MSTATRLGLQPEDPQPRGEAHGAPGMAPRWTRSGKDGVGTAYAASSRVWFTLAQGALTEIYFPTVDHPQVRDLQFLFTDGATFLHTERRDCDAHLEAMAPEALGYRVRVDDRQGRYRCHKEIIADPHLSGVLIHARLEILDPALAHSLRVFVLCAPHLGGQGWDNTAEVGEVASRRLLLAHRQNNWLAVSANVPLRHASAGFVGASDGWTDLHQHLRPTWSFASATNGNVALCAEFELDKTREFIAGIAFGFSRQAAVNTLLQSLDQPFAPARDRFLAQWARTCDHLAPLAAQAEDGGALYHRSVSLLLAHEDKTYPGALIASLAIPWGEAKSDDDLGGYHLVWTRDLVQSATGLLASGDTATPRRALIYLSSSQHPDGGFAQNFWINGTPYWSGIQLDEVAFPIILAWRLARSGGLADLDPYPMVRRGVGYLLRHGPATPQERWEEAGGYSPSSLAAQIAALVCAAEMARAREDAALAQLALDYADFLEAHLEPWTVTSRGTLLAGVPRHYIRISPTEVPDTSILHINNQPPGQPAEFPARDIVDAGFLELVRYGIRRGGDALIEASLAVVDAQLKVSTPFGPCWRRYNHDGYGQRADGGSFTGWGRGGAWPLLTGERGHYELAAGRDPAPYIRALERLSSRLHMLPEQIWDLPDRPEQFLWFGRPSGSAMPLMWAHAEYIRLLRSRADGVVFDRIPAVADRYTGAARRKAAPLEVWKRHRPIPAVAAGTRIRIQCEEAFFLHFSRDGWATVEEQRSVASGLGFEYLDITPARGQKAPLQFTFRLASGPRDGQWEGRDYQIAVD